MFLNPDMYAFHLSLNFYYLFLSTGNYARRSKIYRLCITGALVRIFPRYYENTKNPKSQKSLPKTKPQKRMISKVLVGWVLLMISMSMCTSTVVWNAVSFNPTTKLKNKHWTLNELYKIKTQKLAQKFKQ